MEDTMSVGYFCTGSLMRTYRYASADLTAGELIVLIISIAVIVKLSYKQTNEKDVPFQWIHVKREINLEHYTTSEPMSVEYLKRMMQEIYIVHDIQCTENKVTARSLTNKQEEEPDCIAEIVDNKLIISGPREFCKKLTVKLIGRIRASIVMEE